MFLWLSAVYETASHQILLALFTKLGITGYAWQWFLSYLVGCGDQVSKDLSLPCKYLPRVFLKAECFAPFSFTYLLALLMISSHAFYHCHADNTQIIRYFPPRSAWISECLNDMSSWMTAHYLKLNPSKPENQCTSGDASPKPKLIIISDNSIITVDRIMDPQGSLM